MKKSKLSHKKNLHWLGIGMAVVGVLYLIFFLLFLMTNKQFDFPAPPSRAAFPTPSYTTTTPAGGEFCGGVAAIACPNGYTCQSSSLYPDSGGQCVKQQ